MRKTEDFTTVTQEMRRLYQAGQYAQALEFVESRSAAFPEQIARTTFWRVCLLSLCGRKEDALAALEQGLNAGQWWHESQFRDSDLDSIRDLPAFKDLTAQSQSLWEVERGQVKPERTVLLPEGSGPYPLLISLHGYSGDKDSNLEYWSSACQKGWIVLSPQSRWPLYPGAYFWADTESGINEILFHLGEIRRNYRIDAGRIVVGGFSQGSGMAILAALSPKVPACGFIGVGTWWGEMDAIHSAAKGAKASRGYFIDGLKDHTLERAREIQAVLNENRISFEEEIHPDIGHEFPADFEKSLEKALDFLLS
jgi:predicted esterase